MQREESFDSFYQSTRRNLLLQTFALTGDLTAAQSAVKDAYVAAWHLWRKVGPLEDREGWVRARAWQLAQRRHAGRIWHRNKGIGEDDRYVLDALAKIPAVQRRVVLLYVLAEVPLDAAARELGLTQGMASRHLDAGAAALAEALAVPPEAVRVRLLQLSGAASSVTLPRAPLVRRQGQKRRQGHTIAAAMVAVAIAIGAGAVAYEPGGRQRTADGDLRMLRPQPVTERVTNVPALPTADNMLDEDQIRRLGSSQEWEVKRTHANTAGDGINTICQQQRYADPDGLAAIVREFEAKGKADRSAVQTVEISETVRQAKRGYRTTVGWYAGCRVARLQLLDAYKVDNIGAEAGVLMMRVWERPITTYSVAVARVGEVVTTTVGKSVGVDPPPAKEITQSLADSVSMLCGRTGSKNCSKRPTYEVVPPPPSGEEPAMIAVADLPPVGRIEKPWVGIDATSGTPNTAATTCDRANFGKTGALETKSRTFLIPQAKLPARFGLTETYGRFRNEQAAKKFLSGVRRSVADCEDRDLATDVTASRTYQRGGADRSVYDLRTEISEKESVRFRVGFVRIGRTVAQLTFVSAPRFDITRDRFEALVVRAGDRLRELDLVNDDG